MAMPSGLWSIGAAKVEFMVALSFLWFRGRENKGIHAGTVPRRRQITFFSRDLHLDAVPFLIPPYSYSTWKL